jgi:hypothetical protein
LCIFFIDDQTGWITGYEGAILKTTSGGIDRITSPRAGMGLQPAEFALKQNYPNPFNTITNIEYRILNTEFVTLEIYNLLGQKITTLVSARQPAGIYQMQWDADGLPSGVYLCMITTGKYQAAKRLVLLK